MERKVERFTAFCVAPRCTAFAVTYSTYNGLFINIVVFVPLLIRMRLFLVGALGNKIFYLACVYDMKPR